MDAPPKDRASRVRAAIKAWTAQLIDLGGRNTLLYYRDQKVGTLDLTGVEEAALGKVASRICWKSPDGRGSSARVG
jgi:hypothetical protein